jgi:uroporphyrinogen-III decarboxylase
MDDPPLPTVILWHPGISGTGSHRDRLIRQILDLFHRRLLVIYEALCQQIQGAFFRIAGPEYVGVPLMAPHYFRELVVPYDRELVQIVRRSGNLTGLHMHGRLRHHLADIAAIRPHALEPIECLPFATADVTLAEVKDRIGDQVCLMGNIQEAALDLGTPQEVEVHVQRAIEEGAGGGGFILMPTDVAFTPLTERKAENLKAFLRAGHRFGHCEPNQEEPHG